MMLVRLKTDNNGQQQSTCIVSITIANLFKDPMDTVDTKFSLALDFGSSQEASSFSFDEEKMALFINF
jgi:hypothetical protein